MKMAEEGTNKEEVKEDIIVLNPVGISNLPHEKGITAYQFVATDGNDKKYVMTFLVKSFYRETIDKYLKKLVPVHIPKSEESKDGRT
jgi:hypothetical protein